MLEKNKDVLKNPEVHNVVIIFYLYDTVEEQADHLNINFKGQNKVSDGNYFLEENIWHFEKKSKEVVLVRVKKVFVNNNEVLTIEKNLLDKEDNIVVPNIKVETGQGFQIEVNDWTVDFVKEINVEILIKNSL